MTDVMLPDSVRRVSGPIGGSPGSLVEQVFTLCNSGGPPPPQNYVVQDYIPADCVTSLFAKGGSSKSFLALLIAFHVVKGITIFGKPVTRGPVLYLDAELDRAVIERRAWMIARGLQMQSLPPDLHYLRIMGTLTDGPYNAEVLRVIDRYRPVLTVIDSFTAAVRGRDTNSLDDVTERLLWLERLGTVLMIDHTPKGAAIDGSATAIGSVAKQMFARSQLFIASNGSASILRHEKANFGPLTPPLRFALDFTDDEVRLDAPLPDDDPRIHGLEAALPAKDRIRQALQGGEWSDGATPDELAEALELSASTIRNALTALRRENLAETDRGKWRLRP